MGYLLAEVDLLGVVAVVEEVVAVHHDVELARHLGPRIEVTLLERSRELGRVLHLVLNDGLDYDRADQEDPCQHDEHDPHRQQTLWVPAALRLAHKYYYFQASTTSIHSS